jgi:peptide chain release factor 1
MLSKTSRNQLKTLQEEKIQLESDLSLPEVMSHPKKIRDISMRLAEIREIAETFSDLERYEKSLQEAKKFLKDPDMNALATEEVEIMQKKIEETTNILHRLLIPKDPNDKKDVIVEIRPGIGGDESVLFAGELTRAYFHFAERKNFTIEIVSKNEGEGGGIKECIFEVQGNGAYAAFKYEGGVHRVQRIPETESQGRVHTSAVSVVVLPKVEEEDFDLDEADLKIDVYRSSGPGGQSVNTTDSAVRITHIPSGVVVTCQDQKSQLKNKLKALSVLRSRLAVLEKEKKEKELGEKRISMIGSGDRSGKIRTYNFPQDRVTDHRLSSGKKNFSNLPGIMNGNLHQIIDFLAEEEALLQMSSLS